MDIVYSESLKNSMIWTITDEATSSHDPPQAQTTQKPTAPMQLKEVLETSPEFFYIC